MLTVPIQHCDAALPGLAKQLPVNPENILIVVARAYQRDSANVALHRGRKRRNNPVETTLDKFCRRQDSLE